MFIQVIIGCIPFLLQICINYCYSYSACSLMNMCVVGGFKASGITYQEILKDFGESAAASASIVGVQGFFFALFGELLSLDILYSND